MAIVLHTETVPIFAVMAVSILIIIGLFILKFHLRIDPEPVARKSKKGGR